MPMLKNDLSMAGSESNSFWRFCTLSWAPRIAGFYS